MTLTFFPELQATHDLVLVKGDILSSAALGPSEAAHLTRVLIESYTDMNRFKWPKMFNLSPNEFTFEAFREANPDFFSYPLPERKHVKPQEQPDTPLWLPGDSVP